jgi:hypothetical protein
MTLVFREVGDDVSLHLEGSIDTSIFTGFPGSATFNGTGGSFTQSELRIATSGGSQGVGRETSVKSSALQGDLFQFLNDAAMTTVGTPPPPRFSFGLSPAPPFWFGFSNATQTSGTPGGIRDAVYLPDDYASNEFISLDYLARNESFATLGLARNDRWGVSFANGAGGAQAMIFHAAPEPSTIGLAVLAGAALFARRSSHR